MIAYPDTAALVFAKAPVEGQVNTRLIPFIGAEAATDLQRRLLEHRLAELHSGALSDTVLCCSPGADHPAFDACRQRYDIELWPQQGADLGERLLNGLRRALTQYRSVILLGTDAPALGLEQIEQAISYLHEDAEAVFVPADDGGYVLAGLNQAHAGLFSGIDWGTDRVMDQTRDKLDSIGLGYRLLPACWDIDRFEDYQRYLSEFS